MNDLNNEGIDNGADNDSEAVSADFQPLSIGDFTELSPEDQLEYAVNLKKWVKGNMKAAEKAAAKKAKKIAKLQAALAALEAE